MQFSDSTIVVDKAEFALAMDQVIRDSIKDVALAVRVGADLSQISKEIGSSTMMESLVALARAAVEEDRPADIRTWLEATYGLIHARLDERQQQQ